MKLQQAFIRSSNGNKAVSLMLMSVFVFSTFASSIYTYTRTVAPEHAYAATSSNLNFQARILSANGNTVPDGYYNIEFKLYSVATGGSALWTDTRYDQNGVTAGLDYRLRVVNGYMSVNLADTTAGGTAFPNTINWDQEHWLTMNVGGSTQTATPTYDGEMTPRVKLTAVPYAFRAGQADNVLSSNTSLASTNSASILIQSGNATGTTSNSGSISLDVGTATQTAGTISIGVTNTSGITIGRTGVTTNFPGVIGANATGKTAITIADTGAQSSGLTIGGDTNLYRSAADLLMTDDSLTVRGQLTVDDNSASTGRLLVLDSSSASPTGVNGGMFYDTGLSKFRIYENGAYKTLCNTTDLGCGAGGGGTSFVQNGNAFGALATLGTTDANDLRFITGGTNERLRVLSTGEIGIGTASPTAMLHIAGTNTASSAAGAAAVTTLIAVGGSGGDRTNAGGVAGSGSAVTVTGGIGGNGASIAGNVGGGSGGAITLTTGAGGTPSNIATGGTGGVFTLQGGIGGASGVVVGATGGNGGAFMIQAGNGGNGISGTNNGSGGDIVLQGGASGTGGAGGVVGNLYLSRDRGSVGISTSGSLTSRLQIGSTAAIDAFGIFYNSIQRVQMLSTGTATFKIAHSGNATEYGQFRILQDTANRASINLTGTLADVSNDGYGGVSLLTPDGGLRFITASSGGGSDPSTGNTRAVLTTGGDLGLGTSDTPSARLHIQSSTAANLLQVTDSTATATDVFTIADAGLATFRNHTNNTSAFRIQNADATRAIFNVDTTNSRVGLGGGSVTSPTAELHVIALRGSPSADVTDLLDIQTRTDTTTRSRFKVSAQTDVTINYLDSSLNTIMGNTILTLHDGGTYSSMINTRGTARGGIGVSATNLVLGVDSNTSGVLENAVIISNQAANLGSATFRAANNTVAFVIQNTSATVDTLFAADTTNNRLVVGNATATVAGENTLLVVDSATTALLPTGVNGGIIYDSTTGKFKIVENVAGTPTYKTLCNTTDLGCGSGGGGTLQNAYDASTSPATIALTATDDGIIFQNPASGGADLAGSAVLKIDQLSTGAVEGLRIESAGTGNIFTVRDTTATATDVFKIADGGATTLQNQANSTSAFQIQSAAIGTDVLTVDTTNSLLSLRGIVSVATLGAEKTTNGTFTGNATGWTLGTGWAYGTNNVVKTAGTGSSLEQNVSAVNTERYRVTYTVSAWTAGCIRPWVGGVQGDSICYAGNGSTPTTDSQVITATGTGNFQLTADSTFAGTIDDVSVVLVTESNTVLTVKNSDASIGLEVRSGGSALNNTIIGLNAGENLTTGLGNTVLGVNALQDAAAVNDNTALGYNVLRNNSNGNNNTGIGSGALEYNTSGYDNTAIGHRSLSDNDAGYGNTAVGQDSLRFNSTGYLNTALGNDALMTNNLGFRNTALGAQTLQFNTTGDDNSAIGVFSLYANTFGDSNNAQGYQSLTSNTTGSFNTAVGDSALESNTTGDYNVAIGRNAGFSGVSANGNTTGSNNTFIGRNNGPGVLSAVSLQNATSVGAFGIVNANDTLTLGCISGINGCTATTNIGINSGGYANNPLSVSAATYSTGTIAQTGTAITGTGTAFTNGMNGGTIYYSDGTRATITYLTPTTLTSSVSKTVTAGATYTIVYGGLNVSSTGTASFQNTANSTTAFQIQNTAGASVLTADTLNSNITLASNNSGEVQQWTTSANPLTGVRMDAKLVSANGYIYMIGGANNAGTQQSTVYYARVNANGSTGTWTTNANALPEARFNHGAVAANGYLYVVGGYNGTNRKANIYFAKLNADGSTGAWRCQGSVADCGSPVNSNALPLVRENAGVVAYNGYLYSIGGADGTTRHNDVYYAKINADGTTGSWSSDADEPGDLENHTSVVANGYIYAIGGASGAGPTVATVYKSKINADGSVGAWTTTTAFPAIRNSHVSVVSNGYLYVIAGFDGTSYQSTVYYAPLNADGTVGAWTTATNALTEARYSPAATLVNGYIYVAGGQDTGNTVRDTVYYASTSRITLGGSLDLVGLSGENLNEGGTGGSITAGNGIFVGDLQVQGNATFVQGVSIDKELRVGGSALFQNQATSATAFQIQNTAGEQILVVDNNQTSLLANPGADTSLAGWVAKGASTVTRTTTAGQYRHGSAGISVVTTAAANVGVSYAQTLLPSTQYTLSYHVKASGANITTLAIGRQDVSGTDVDCAAAPTVFTGRWTRIECTFTTGATITSSNIYLKQTDATARTFYVDSVQLEIAATNTSYKTGTVGIMTHLGIGIANPEEELHVIGDVLLENDEYIKFKDNTGTARNVLAYSTANNLTLTQQNSTSGSIQIENQNNAGSIQLRTGTGSTLQLNVGTSDIDAYLNITANNVATVTSGSTSGTGTNTTTVTLTAAGAFANNDVIFIDNIGQDYYTRIVSGAGTTTLTVSPAVTFETGRTVTKYTIQNIGATTSSYTTQTDRFFQGYFLGGVVTGAGSTTLSDGNLTSTGTLRLQGTSVSVVNSADSTIAFQVQRANADVLLTADTNNNRLIVGNATATAGTDNTLFVVDSATTALLPTGLNGGIIYDSTTNKLKIYEGGAYKTLCNTTDNGCGTGGGGTLQSAYDAASGNTITTTDNRNLAVTLADTTTDSNFLVNLACTTCSANGGKFAIQNAGTDVFKVAPVTGTVSVTGVNAVALGANASTAFSVTGGVGAATLGGAPTSTGLGGAIALTGGLGGTTNEDFGTASKGGSVTIQGGAGGLADGLNSTGGEGGDLILKPGAGGSGSSAGGVNGKVIVGTIDGNFSLFVIDNLTGSSLEPSPTYSVDGAMYYNTTLKSFRCFTNTSWRSCMGGVIFANTTVATAVANTVTETNFNQSYSIPANECQPGRVFRITASGVYGQAASAVNLTMRVKMGTTVIGATPTTGTPGGTTAQTNQGWRMEYDITCITAGTTGTVEGQGNFNIYTLAGATQNGRAMVNTATITINTTVAQTLQISAQWSVANASHTIQMRQMIIESGKP